MTVSAAEISQAKDDIENELGVGIDFVNAIRIKLCLGMERVSDKAQVNIQRLCMFDGEFRRAIGEDPTKKTWHTSATWSRDEMDRVFYQNDAVSLLESDDPLDDIYYLLFSDLELFSSLVGTTTLIDYIDKTIKYDLISSASSESSKFVGKEARKKMPDISSNTKTPYQREIMRVDGRGVKRPREFKDNCHHTEGSHERIKSLLKEVYLPKFRKMLRSPMPGFKVGGFSEVEDLAGDRLAMVDNVEFDKRFDDESSDIFVSFAKHVKQV